MAAFEYRQAQEIREALARHGVRYLFIGKSGAILLGYPDTTQDADLFVERSADNGRALVGALRECVKIRLFQQTSQVEKLARPEQVKRFDLIVIGNRESFSSTPFSSQAKASSFSPSAR